MLLSCFSSTIYIYILASIYQTMLRLTQILIRFQSRCVFVETRIPVLMFVRATKKKFFNRIYGWFQSHLHFSHGTFINTYIFGIRNRLLLMLLSRGFLPSNLNKLFIAWRAAVWAAHQIIIIISLVCVKFYAAKNFEHVKKSRKRWKNGTNTQIIHPNLSMETAILISFIKPLSWWSSVWYA